VKTAKKPGFIDVPARARPHAGAVFRSPGGAESDEKEIFSKFSDYSLDAGFPGCTMRILYALVTLGKIAVF
jgi:hypothetical protein